MIELIFAVPIVVMVVSGGACLLYLCFAKVWITRAAREGAICLASQLSKQKCRSRIDETLKVGLPFGVSSITELQTFGDLTRVHIELRTRKSEPENRDREPLIEARSTLRNLK
jgi:hypothetical protein